MKRSDQEIEALGKRFTEFVAKNPGLRIEQINAKLGTTTAQMALPIRKAVAAGQLRTTGEMRATEYHPGKKYKK